VAPALVEPGLLIRNTGQGGRSGPRRKLICCGRATTESGARHVNDVSGTVVGEEAITLLSWPSLVGEPEAVKRKENEV
jgi:hypothetical protein